MKLESFHKPLDADIEKDDLEGIYRDNTQPSVADMTSYDLLFDDNYRAILDSLEIVDEDDKDILLDSKAQEDEIRAQIAESAIYGVEDIGRYTINTPTNEKKMAEQQDKNMEPIAKSLFEEIANSVVDEDKAHNASLDRIREEMTTDW